MIKVRSKTLFVPAEEQSIGASGEADSTVREFHIDRVSGDGVDLANLLFKLNIRYAGVRDIDRSDLEKVITDNEIILRWLISSVTMSHAGTAFIQLDAFDNTGSCRWKSYPCAVYIEKSIDGTIPQNTLTELEQLEKKFSKLDEQERERKTAEEKRVTAEGKREEAEARRNTSLSNIVAEEEKIVALSKETKGYRDSVASDKASVEAVKANVQELKADTENIKTSTLSAVETVKTEINRDVATAKNKLKDEIALAASELHNTLFVARTDLGGMVSDVTNIKGEISTLKSEVNTVKEEAINAKNEAVTAKNGASTVKEEITAIKVEISASAEKAKQNADKAETSANTAKTAETNAEAFKTEAGKSADKAKESETKTLEALKKAQEGGKVAGVTSDEMHSYVDNAVSNIHSGLTESEVVDISKRTINSEEIGDSEIDKDTLSQDIINRKLREVSIPTGRLATTSVLNTVLNAIHRPIAGCAHALDIINRRGGWNLKFITGEISDGSSVTETLQLLQASLVNDDYGLIKAGDYIDIPTTIPGTKKMRFYVMAIDMDESKNSIDFISFDYPETMAMTEEEIKNFGDPNSEKIIKLVNNKIKGDINLKELNSLVERGIISEKNRFYKGMNLQSGIHFWTIDEGEILGIEGFILGAMGRYDVVSHPCERLELFKTQRYKRMMKRRKYITCSYGTKRIGVLNEYGYHMSLSVGAAFTKDPTLGPLIPVCFRITEGD